MIIFVDMLLQHEKQRALRKMMKSRVKCHQITGRETGIVMVKAQNTGWGWCPVSVCKVLGFITNTQWKHGPKPLVRRQDLPRIA